MKQPFHPLSIDQYIETRSREKTKFSMKFNIGSRTFMSLDRSNQLAFIQVLNMSSFTHIATTPDLSPLTRRLFSHSKSIMASLCGPISL
jgi:hypothetical protein